MFPVLTASEIGRINRLGERRSYPAGAPVFQTGKIAPGAFVLVSGQVERVHITPRELPIVFCLAGQILRNPSEVELARRIGLLMALDPKRHVWCRNTLRQRM